MPAPYKIFTIYAREDATYLEELRGQLRPLENAGRIKVWSDRELNPGVDWEHEIVQNLDTADIILILVSAAYYNSAYIHEKEIKYALARHEQGQAKVLPIIVRPVDFSDDPVISRLQVLPTDGKPVNDRRHWQERDDAWLDVVAGIKRTLTLLTDAENRRAQQAKENLLAIQRQAEKAESERIKKEQTAAQKRESQPPAAIPEPAPARKRSVTQEPKSTANRENVQKFPAKPEIETPAGTTQSSGTRYIIWISSGVLILLSLWLAVDFFKNKKEPKGVRTLSPSVLSDSVGVKVKKSGLSMVPVGGGAFIMGSPPSEAGRNNDECQHEVKVKSFSIGRYEVTQADWRSVMGTNPSYFKSCDDCPVELVSWDDAQAFIQKLNAKYAGKNYHLPTESEWEYAARGGNISRNHLYAGADSPGDMGWYIKNADSKTHPVGGKNPNELGLYDMSGNVWEWCQDIYAPYPCKGKSVAVGTHRVLRGGSWSDNVKECRLAARNGSGLGYQDNQTGFRLAADAQ